MADEQLFLRSKVMVEPLVDRLVAQPHTIAPVQASMNLVFLRVPLLESYLQSPRVHVAAGNNPELRGGYFINTPEERAVEVRDLLAAIKRDRVGMLRFAEEIAVGQQLLRANATGFDLTPLHPKLPPELGGLVELAYGTDNQVQRRFMEPLVRRSPACAAARQSVQLSFETGIERPFILSTPILPSTDVLETGVPFRHEGLAELFKTRVRPTSLNHPREALGPDDAQAGQLSGMLSDRPSLAEDRHIDSGGRIRYFGHACLVLDHIVMETLLQLRDRVGAIVVPRYSKGNLADPSIKLMPENQDFPVVEVDDFDEVELPGGKITAIPFLGEHCDLDIRAKSTYWAEPVSKKVFIGADSSGIDPTLYGYIKNHLGTADYAFLGMECDGAAADLAPPGPAPHPGRQEDEQLAQALRLQRRAGRRDHDGAGRQGGIRLRHGRGGLARPRHGHHVHRGRLPDQAHRRVPQVVRGPRHQAGPLFEQQEWHC